MKFAILLSALYFVPTLLLWLHLKIAHSKGGRWENTDATVTDLVLCVLPFANIVGSMVAWILFYPKESKSHNVNWFFRIKK